MEKPIVCVVDGTMGAGKTTLIEALKIELSLMNVPFEVIQEPIEQWQSNGVFEKFCKDPPLHAYEFQTFVFTTRCKVIRLAREERPCGLYIMERCPYTDFNVFAEAHYELGNIKEYQYEMYQQWCRMWYRFVPEDMWPDRVIYLKPPFETLMQRIRNRNRGGEDAYTEDYVALIAKWYDHMFGNEKDTLEIWADKNLPFLEVPVYRIEDDNKFRHLEADYDAGSVKKIVDFILHKTPL
jgi:deoxyadenosine/deoxycytidine kinase